MKRALLALVLVAGATFVSPASASKPDRLTDFPCGYTATRDPRPESSYDAQIGVIQGGPVFQSGTLTCTVKVDAGTHAAPYVHGASVSVTGEGVTVLPLAVRSFVQSSWNVYLCDEFTDAAGVTWYWDDNWGDWTNDPGGACRLAITSNDSNFDAMFELLEWIGETLDLALPVVCPVLGALAPGAPPLLDVRADGDTYVAGDLLVDCPPVAPGDGVGLHRLGSSRNPSLPPRTSGVVRVSDTGNGPEWEVSGTLVSVDWDCAFDGAGVVCDWDGYVSRPACREASAVAAVLAADARARTRVSCVRGTVVESATTGVASAQLPATYAERATTVLPVTSLRCEIDDGAGGPPVAPYITTCGFTF